MRTASSNDRPALQRDRARYERQVRERAREVRASHRPFATAGLSAVQEHLNGRVLIEYIESGGRLAAIVATTTKARTVDLGTSVETDELLDHLRFAAERIARPSTSQTSRSAALGSVKELIGEIRDRMIAPLHIEPDRVVVIPSSLLHGVPWGLVFDVPVQVAPSATVWVSALTATRTNGNAIVIHGPGLVHAAAEAQEIGTITGGTITSSIGTARRELSGARLAHFACHARPRLDSPMFSSLVLDDGELTLYDIERLGQAPDTVILAACDGASAVLASGDEVLGLASAFLSLGAGTVVAPLFTVSDEATATVMRSVHQSLAAGRDPATALLEARKSDDALVAFTAGSFASFGG